MFKIMNENLNGRKEDEFLSSVQFNLVKGWLDILLTK